MSPSTSSSGAGRRSRSDDGGRAAAAGTRNDARGPASSAASSRRRAAPPRGDRGRGPAPGEAEEEGHEEEAFVPAEAVRAVGPERGRRPRQGPREVRQPIADRPSAHGRAPREQAVREAADEHRRAADQQHDALRAVHGEEEQGDQGRAPGVRDYRGDDEEDARAGLRRRTPEGAPTRGDHAPALWRPLRAARRGHRPEPSLGPRAPEYLYG